MTTKCCYCAGRGWSWVGIASNAVREPCYPCDGQGRLPVNWHGVTGFVLVLFSAMLILGVLTWGVRAAYGHNPLRGDATLYGYYLGYVWLVGPFTDMKSCQDTRQFQLRHGIKDVSECDIILDDHDTLERSITPLAYIATEGGSDDCATQQREGRGDSNKSSDH